MPRRRGTTPVVGTACVAYALRISAENARAVMLAAFRTLANQVLAAACLRRAADGVAEEYAMRFSADSAPWATSVVSCMRRVPHHPQAAAGAAVVAVVAAGVVVVVVVCAEARQLCASRFKRASARVAIVAAFCMRLQSP